MPSRNEISKPSSSRSAVEPKTDDRIRYPAMVGLVTTIHSCRKSPAVSDTQASSRSQHPTAVLGLVDLDMVDLGLVDLALVDLGLVDLDMVDLEVVDLEVAHQDTVSRAMDRLEMVAARAMVIRVTDLMVHPRPTVLNSRVAGCCI